MSEKTQRVKRKIYREYKELCHKMFEHYTSNKTIIFIVGCQRSGTTMLSKIFEADYQTKVYPEVSRLSTNDPLGRRLDSMALIEKEMMQNNIGTIISKPLVDSQNIDNLLDYFDNSKAIWMYRHYKDVASSDIKKFGPKNGIKNLYRIFNEKSDTWRSDRISEDTKALLNKHYSEDMSPYDAAALFWYSRNILFFERHLDSNNKVFMCRYENLVSEPKSTMQSIYAFLEIPFPTKKIVSDVHTTSVKKGKDLQISPEIYKLCDNLLQKLNLVFKTQSTN